MQLSLCYTDLESVDGYPEVVELGHMLNPVLLFKKHPYWCSQSGPVHLPISGV